MAGQFVKLGAGEIVVNSIDQDGVMKGYDLTLTEKIREGIKVPMTVLGGCGSLKDLAQLINKFGIIGAAAGSLFVFKGIYKAVLINYPNAAEKNTLVRENNKTLAS
jgi:cyclase